MSEKIDTVGVVDMEVVQNWMEANHELLTNWLTNVVMITKVQAIGNNQIFQLFRVPLTYTPPHGLILAGNEVKYQMMMATVFGKASMGRPYRGAKVDSSDPSNPREWEILPQFAGFNQKVGRMPMAGDQILYTAWRWFELRSIESPKGLMQVMETICTVDHLPDESNKIQ